MSSSSNIDYIIGCLPHQSPPHVCTILHHAIIIATSYQRSGTHNLKSFSG